MKIGDKCMVVGKVRDVVGESTLIVIEEDDREYWILSKHVKEVPVEGAAAEAEAEAEAKPAEAPAKHAGTPVHHEEEEAKKAPAKK